jgi:hypothetical protein
MPFPDIAFNEFSAFIQDNFSDDITLSTVLVLLFSLVENPDLLNLHGRQQRNKLQGDTGRQVTSWIKILSRLFLAVRLRKDRQQLFQLGDGVTLQEPQNHSTDSVNSLSRKLDQMITLLHLNPFKPNGKLSHRRKPISREAIEPVFLICPQAYQCETLSCSPYSLAQHVPFVQVPQVSLLKGNNIHHFSFVLSAHCQHCNTTYSADHDRAWNATEERFDHCHLNSAAYLKLGQSIWADRIFTNSVLNATYSFHSSSSAFAEFWNESFGDQGSIKLTRRHIWQAFIAETTRMVAHDSGDNLSTPANSSIEDLTAAAVETLGSGGVIKAAEGHSCSECSYAQRFGPNEQHLNPQDYDPVSMCVVDGIVMAPTVRKFNCTWSF